MSLQFNDMLDLVSRKIHVDEYKSKMGNDKDVIVLSFKVKYKDPAWELSNFIEKGYDWVLDADLSSGEMEDGSYLVFVEMERRPSFFGNLMRLLKDMEGITGNDASDYQMAYRKGDQYMDITSDNVKAKIPMSPREYTAIYGESDESDESSPMTAQESKELRALQSMAGVTPAPIKITDPVLKHYVNLSKR